MADIEPATDPLPDARDPEAGDGTADSVVIDPTHPVLGARAAHDKGATDVLVLQVGDVLAITDYFLIASASNPRLVRAVVQDIEDRIAAAGGPRPLRIEGLDDCEWVLADYGTFVVHVFQEDTRKYYELERLWGDVPRVDWADDA